MQSAFPSYIEKIMNVSCIAFIRRQMLTDFPVPLPPLEVQREVVGILDLFTGLTAELTAELELRKKQYAYYREVLLSFDEKSPSVIKEMTKRLCPNGIEWKTLGEVANCKTGTKPQEISKEYTEGLYTCINAGTTPFGYTPQFNRDGDIITTPSRGSSIGFVGYQEKPFWLGPLCYGITTKAPDLLMTKYIYYCLCNQTDDILKRKQGGAIPALNISHLESIIIPLPPLEVQRKIVEILDQFHTLTTSLTEGIPAEIEARRKQYNYYRNKLLTFKEQAPNLTK